MHTENDVMPELDALVRPAYPRSNSYDAQWQVDRCLGPNPLWLLEDLLHDVALSPGMRALDLGCGLGMTSTYLAASVASRSWRPTTGCRRRRTGTGRAGRRLPPGDGGGRRGVASRRPASAYGSSEVTDHDGSHDAKRPGSLS